MGHHAWWFDLPELCGNPDWVRRTWGSAAIQVASTLWGSLRPFGRAMRRVRNELERWK
jgi:hypothetical protein